MELKGTKTEKNLLKAFECEKKDREKYIHYASIAKDEYYEQIADIFIKTAHNEKEHAKMWFKLLRGLPFVEDRSLDHTLFRDSKYNDDNINIEVLSQMLTNKDIPSTYDNLVESASQERNEYLDMYESMVQDAVEEGFDNIAYMFKAVAEIEKTHEECFRTLIRNIEENKVYTKDSEVDWECRNCGYIQTGKEAPIVCPVCRHGRRCFEVKCENYK